MPAISVPKSYFTLIDVEPERRNRVKRIRFCDYKLIIKHSVSSFAASMSGSDLVSWLDGTQGSTKGQTDGSGPRALTHLEGPGVYYFHAEYKTKEVMGAGDNWRCDLYLTKQMTTWDYAKTFTCKTNENACYGEFEVLHNQMTVGIASIAAATAPSHVFVDYYIFKKVNHEFEINV